MASSSLDSIDVIPSIYRREMGGAPLTQRSAERGI